MSTWFSKQLGDGILASVPLAEITEAIESLFESAGKPPEMAAFTKMDTVGLHCEVTVYFSPAAAEVARLFGAKPCATPSRKGMSLLAGDVRCWEVLFPSY